jgi:hypothetical protein
MQKEFPVAEAGPDDLAFPPHVDKVIVDRRGAFPEFRIA